MTSVRSTSVKVPAHLFKNQQTTMADANTSFRDKTRFFQQLESLGRQSDDDDNDEFHEAELRHRQQLKAFQAAATRQTLQEKAQQEPQPQSQSLIPQQLTLSSRGTSPIPVRVPASLTDLKRKDVIERTPLAEIKGPGRKDAPAADSFIEDTPVPDSSTRPPLHPIPGLARSVTTPLPAIKQILPHRVDNSPSVAAMKKRKREPTIKTVPEEQQVFRGLRFYFIPNDDIAPARKIRIRKVQEFGASWVRSLETATHVIVDRSLDWQNIESIVRPRNGAASYLVLNEEYPLDCLRFKSLLNADQKHYRVSGCPELSAAPAKHQILARDGQPLETTSQDLPLKPRQMNPKQWDYVQPSTPFRSREFFGKTNGKDAIATSPSALRDITEIILPSSTDGPSSQNINDDDDDEIHTTVEKQALRLEDELEDVISQMQEFRDLPLEHDDDDMAPSTQSLEGDSDVEGSGDECQRKKKAATRSRGRKDMAWEDKFACHKGGTNGGDQTSPNGRTIEILQQMCNYYERVNDTWRPIAYRKAIAQLKRQPSKISTAEEAIRLPGVGQRLADKIEEIVTTNRLRRLESAEQEPMDKVLQTFLKIYGVGSVQASHFVSQGFRTLEDLKEKAKLTPNQRIGVDHYNDLNTRIPRSEVKLLGAVVRSEAAKLDPAVQIIIGGSYRRGALDSGDIDFLVTKKGTRATSDLTPFLHRLVKTLETQNFLVARLAGSRDETDGSKWHGCCVLPKLRGVNDENYRRVWRRVDFLVVPETEMGAALIYFTGNDIFNRSIRLLASKKGMRLNQKGLYKDVMRGPGRVKLTVGELVEGQDERRIFEILGVKWREPHERWC
ncbi:hypothetical protein LY78DRAFT_652436 [Colletotrichum sublineola]|nr:hypothetical protein LY78DRAFT_652436 [Colletotrichum sublineola]